MSTLEDKHELEIVDENGDPVSSGPRKLVGEGTVIGKMAPDFALPDQNGQPVQLSKVCAQGPVLLAFYPRDFTAVCTKQLCNYRDNMAAFREFGLQIFGISSNPSNSHASFGSKYDFPFPLLSDADKSVAKEFGCTSLFMLGRVSRAVFIINKRRTILYRYVEPTILTRRTAQELVLLLADLRKNKFI